MKNNITAIIVIIIITFFIGRYFGTSSQELVGNQKLRYGDTGLPKNCRALIAENIRGHNLGTYTAEGALYSIDRNCGAFGYIWDIR